MQCAIVFLAGLINGLLSIMIIYKIFKLNIKHITNYIIFNANLHTDDCKYKYIPLFIIIACIGMAYFFYLKYSFSVDFIYYMVFSNMLITVAVLDLISGYIYPKMLMFYGLFAVLMRVFIYKINFKDILLSGIIGFTIYYLIYKFSFKIYKKEAFGFGDAVYMGCIGLFLDIFGALLSALNSFWIAMFCIIIFFLAKRKYTPRLSVPFAPYMSISTLIIIFFKENMISCLIYNSFFTKGYLPQ